MRTKRFAALMIGMIAMLWTVSAMASPCTVNIDDLRMGDCIGAQGGDCNGAYDDLFTDVSLGALTDIFNQLRDAYGSSFRQDAVVDVVSYGVTTAVLMSDGSAFVINAGLSGDGVRDGIMHTQGGYMVTMTDF